jgi:metal-responsive CopG/Arc/MetJ family transcriptional regulator
MKRYMETVQIVLDEQLLNALEQAVQRSGETRSAFIHLALQAELNRRHTAALETAHQTSHLATPEDDLWIPQNRAWGEFEE